MKNGLLVIISSPSGGGKDTVINALLSRFSNSSRLVTTTSRLPRPGNIEGKDYYFINKIEFQNKIKKGEFVEYNIYSGNYYGVEKKRLAEALLKYSVVFTQIEVNGKHNFTVAGIEHLSIFLLPESLEVLRLRIEKRGGLTEEQIEERLVVAKTEIEKSIDYDFRLINKEGELEQTINKVEEIIKNRL